MLSTLDKIFNRHFEIFFLIFLRKQDLIFHANYLQWRKQDLTFHANCLQWRQFARKVKTCSLGNIRKNIINLLSAEFAQWLRVATFCFKYVYNTVFRINIWSDRPEQTAYPVGHSSGSF